MKIAKKVLLITSLTCVAISCLLLILAIFGVNVFGGVLLRVLLSTATLAVGCGIALSDFNVLERRKYLGIVSLCLLGLSVLMALVSFATPLFEVEIYNRVLGVVALFSVIMNIIVALNTKLEKRFVPLQIATYVVVSLVALALILLICGISIFNIDGLRQMFWVLVVVTVGLLIATTVVGTKKRGDDNTTKQKTTSKLEQLQLENQNLKQQIAELQKELEKLKNK